MSGICDTCMTAGTCEIRRDGRKLCAAYERNSNYNRLFGTPERAARTLMDYCGDHHFREGCPADAEEHDCTYDALLEWLGGDA